MLRFDEWRSFERAGSDDDDDDDNDDEEHEARMALADTTLHFLHNAHIGGRSGTLFLGATAMVRPGNGKMRPLPASFFANQDAGGRGARSLRINAAQRTATATTQFAASWYSVVEWQKRFEVPGVWEAVVAGMDALALSHEVLRRGATASDARTPGFPEDFDFCYEAFWRPEERRRGGQLECRTQAARWKHWRPKELRHQWMGDEQELRLHLRRDGPRGWENYWCSDAASTVRRKQLLAAYDATDEHIADAANREATLEARRSELLDEFTAGRDNRRRDMGRREAHQRAAAPYAAVRRAVRHEKTYHVVDEIAQPAPTPSQWKSEFADTRWVETSLPGVWVPLETVLTTIACFRPDWYRLYIRRPGEERAMNARERLLTALRGDARFGQTMPTPQSQLPRAFVQPHLESYKIRWKDIKLSFYALGGGLTALATPGESHIDTSRLRVPTGPALLPVRAADKSASVRLGRHVESLLVAETRPEGECGVEMLCALCGNTAAELFGEGGVLPPRYGYKLADMQRLLHGAPRESVASAFMLERCQSLLDAAASGHGVASVVTLPLETGSYLIECELEIEDVVPLCDLVEGDAIVVKWNHGKRYRGVVCDRRIGLDGENCTRHDVRVQFDDETVWLEERDGWDVVREAADPATLTADEAAAAARAALTCAANRPIHWLGVDFARGLLFVGGGTKTGKLLSGVYEIDDADRANPARLSALLRERHGIGSVVDVGELRVYASRCSPLPPTARVACRTSLTPPTPSSQN